MTICRKCGKEIPDGQELCEDCMAKESGGQVNYLDQLAAMSSASSSSMSAIEMVRAKAAKKQQEKAESVAPEAASEPVITEPVAPEREEKRLSPENPAECIHN